MTNHPFRGSHPVTITPNPKVRKSGAVAKAVLASVVLEEGSAVRVARGDSRDIRRIKKRALRGMPALMCTLHFCHTQEEPSGSPTRRLGKRRVSSVVARAVNTSLVVCGEKSLQEDFLNDATFKQKHKPAAVVVHIERNGTKDLHDHCIS